MAIRTMGTEVDTPMIVGVWRLLAGLEAAAATVVELVDEKSDVEPVGRTGAAVTTMVETLPS